MPRNNRFQHQKYLSGPPTSTVRFLRPEPPPPRDSDEFARRMQPVAQSLRDAQVAAIYLVHGTFLGSDAIGLLNDLSRFSPALADVLRRWNKQLLDALTGDKGNFSRQYAETLQQALRDAGVEIPVRLFYWSSENTHLGRADGAVRLLAELVSHQFPSGSRVLLWGHSHGGNVFALLTNLLGNESEVRQAFFDAARCYSTAPAWRCVEPPVWRQIEALLSQPTDPLPGVSLDMATLGTPVRYGWESSGYSKLIHFINHRPVEGLPEYQALFPPTADDLMRATHGDLIQQIGIAGTNFAPPIWSWRAWFAELRLARLLQAAPPLKLLARLKLGIRVHEEGENLLVDYGPAGSNFAQHLFGHAPYTRLDWLLFHAEEISRSFYQSS